MVLNFGQNFFDKGLFQRSPEDGETLLFYGSRQIPGGIVGGQTGFVTKSPGTMADDNAVGTVTWSNPNNAKVSDDVYAVAPGTLIATVRGQEVKIVKSDGSIGTTNRETNTTNNWGTTDLNVTYGTSSDLWEETWTPADINDIDFGVVFSFEQLDGDTNSFITHYLKATNFGFSIPSEATIIGITINLERKRTVSGASVDHISLTVYYQ